LHGKDRTSGLLGRNFDGLSGQVIRVTLCRFFSDLEEQS
jgi:hypothetical protein